MQFRCSGSGYENIYFNQPNLILPNSGENGSLTSDRTTLAVKHTYRINDIKILRNYYQALTAEGNGQ